MRDLPPALAISCLAALGGPACGRSGGAGRDAAVEVVAPPAAAEEAPGASPGPDSRLRVAVDPRVELVSILFRLAGNPEYAKTFDGPYGEAVDSHFAPFRDHPAIKTTAELRARYGVSYDAPVELALYLDGSFRPLRPLAPLPPGLDPRWDGAPIDAYLEQVRDFAAAAGFEAFLRSQSAYVAAVEERYRSFLADKTVVDWFDDLLGGRPGTSYVLVPGLLTGRMSYGARAVRPDGSEVVAEIMSLENPDPAGVPRLGESTLELLVHELAHSYVNPVFDPRTAELEAVAMPVFLKVEAAMRSQHYTSWGIMVDESVVRALTVLFLRDESGEAHARKSLGEQEALSFGWTADLVDALDGARRDNAGTLSADRLVETARSVFGAWAERPR